KTAYEIFTRLEFRRVLFRSGLVADLEAGALQAGQVEQVEHQALEPPRFPGDHAASRGRIHRSLLEGLGVAADRGQRGLELVADQIGRASCRERGWVSVGGGG